MFVSWLSDWGTSVLRNSSRSILWKQHVAVMIRFVVSGSTAIGEETIRKFWHKIAQAFSDTLLALHSRLLKIVFVVSWAAWSFGYGFITRSLSLKASSAMTTMSDFSTGKRNSPEHMWRPIIDFSKIPLSPSSP